MYVFYVLLPCYLIVDCTVDFFVGTHTVRTYFHNSGFNGTSNTSRAIVLHENMTKLCTSEKILPKIACTGHFLPVHFPPIVVQIVEKSTHDITLKIG